VSMTQCQACSHPRPVSGAGAASGGGATDKHTSLGSDISALASGFGDLGGADNEGKWTCQHCKPLSFIAFIRVCPHPLALVVSMCIYVSLNIIFIYVYIC